MGRGSVKAPPAVPGRPGTSAGGPSGWPRIESRRSRQDAAGAQGGSGHNGPRIGRSSRRPRGRPSRQLPGRRCKRPPPRRRRGDVEPGVFWMEGTSRHPGRVGGRHLTVPRESVFAEALTTRGLGGHQEAGASSRRRGGCDNGCPERLGLGEPHVGASGPGVRPAALLRERCGSISNGVEGFRAAVATVGRVENGCKRSWASPSVAKRASADAGRGNVT
jgi:hypothetical protein